MIRSGSLLLPLALYAEGPMSYERTFGPAVDPITRLGWGLGIISLLVIVIIAVLLLSALFRSRTPSADPRSLAVTSETGGMTWIYTGVGISSIVLTGCMVWTLTTINAVSHSHSSPTLTVQVTASQWWWAVRYGSEAPARIFTTANEIHIPVGQPVRFELISADVIHSFWIPQLAGKMDVIPGQTNVMWLQASRAGVYRGQCAGFCGVQHAHMALLVIAEAPTAFTSWWDTQIEPTPLPVTADTLHGLEVFQTHCATCHTIRGTVPMGIRGPNLTHLMTRSTLAAGLLPNTRGNLAGWIANAQSLKPGARMPDQNLSGPELSALTSYLSTLH